MKIQVDKSCVEKILAHTRCNEAKRKKLEAMGLCGAEKREYCKFFFFYLYVKQAKAKELHNRKFKFKFEKQGQLLTYCLSE